MPASDHWETELRPLREAGIKSDKTVKPLMVGDDSFGEAELIYQDVRPSTPQLSVASLRKAGGKKHTTKKWKARATGCEDKGVAGYLRHLRHDLHLELWDYSAPTSAAPPVHPSVSHVPIYHLSPWSLGPAGAPRPWSLGAAASPGVGAPADGAPAEAEPVPSAAAKGTDGGNGASPVRLAVLDTGVPRNFALLHPRLADAVEPDPDWEDPTGSDGNLRLDAGHGLFILDLVMGMRPDLAPVYMRRPLRTQSNLTLGEHLVGLDLWEVTQDVVRDETPLIVNMSFAAYAVNDTPGLGLIRELSWMAEKGFDVLVVAAAGNTGDDRKCFPAACGLPNVVSVGALDGVDRDGVAQVASFSSRGDWVDCWTQGVDISAGYLSGVYDHPPTPPETFPTDNPRALWSGTSFAAPRAAALIAQKAGSMPAASLMDVWHELQAENVGKNPKWLDPAGGTVTEKGVVI